MGDGLLQCLCSGFWWALACGSGWAEAILGNCRSTPVRHESRVPLSFMKPGLESTESELVCGLCEGGGKGPLGSFPGPTCWVTIISPGTCELTVLFCLVSTSPQGLAELCLAQNLRARLDWTEVLEVFLSWEHFSAYIFVQIMLKTFCWNNVLLLSLSKLPQGLDLQVVYA